MADGQNDSAEKTEEPTAKRLQEAVRKGQVPVSREVGNFLMFVLLAINIVWFAPIFMGDTVTIFSRFIASPEDIALDEGNLRRLTAEIMRDFFMLISLPVAASVVVALAASFLQNGFIISIDPITPKLEKISVIKGLKRLFSLRSVVEFLKGILKITIVGIAAYLAVVPELGRIEELIQYDMAGILGFLAILAFRIVLGAASVMLVIAMMDLLYQRFEYMKNLRMSKQEIKEEFKQTEGNPQVKARLRQIRMDRARKRMMAAVPEADVVITNPTHYSIALKYDEAEMDAPVVVAKGQDNIALKIREIAKEHDIPIVENKPLARSLYDVAELDQEIPIEHYAAVAEIIGYVYRLKGKTAQRA